MVAAVLVFEHSLTPACTLISVDAIMNAHAEAHIQSRFFSLLTHVQTCFAAVDATPPVDEDEDIDVDSTGGSAAAHEPYRAESEPDFEWPVPTPLPRELQDEPMSLPPLPAWMQPDAYNPWMTMRKRPLYVLSVLPFESGRSLDHSCEGQR